MPYLIPRSASVTLDSGGNGTVQFQIDNTNQRWIIDYVTVATDQPANSAPVPAAKFYRGAITPQAFLGGSLSGNLDTASGRIIMFPDDVIFCVWTGGIPASKATATIAGMFTPAGTPLQD